MTKLDQFEKSLMDWVTFNSRYKKLEDIPQLRLAILPTVALLVFIYLGDLSFPSLIVYETLFLSCYYEWHLWFNLKK